MLKLFPYFCLLDTQHFKIVQEYIGQDFAPHADLNFIGLWSFDFEKQAALSMLNNNLIISHDHSGSSSLSFLGTSKIVETTRTLLTSNIANQWGRRLCLIPGQIESVLDPKEFVIQDDRDNYDYILNLKKITNSDGNEYASLRHKSNRFKSFYKYIRPIVLPNTLATKKVIINFYERISKNIEKKDDLVMIETEKQAIDCFFEIVNLSKNIILGFFLEERLVGFVINEKFNKSFAIGHFMRADIKVSKDLYSYMFRETASQLMKFNLTYINIGQDLGVPGLRQKKIALRPDFYYKKFNITLK